MSALPPEDSGPFDLPVLRRAQVRELDRIAMEDFGLPGVVLMENAGRALARAIQDELPAGARVALLCGRGNNGGDAYVVARYLADGGHRVTLLETAAPAQLSSAAAVFRQVCKVMGLTLLDVPGAPEMTAQLEQLPRQDLLVDALLGTGFVGALRPPVAELLESVGQWVRTWKAPVVAVDLPSGMDADDGTWAAQVLHAERTLSLACNKPALIAGPGFEVYGRVEIIPIGIPRAAYERLV